MVENDWKVNSGPRPVSQSEELREVEDDGEEEEDEGVGQSGLWAEAELKAVDGWLGGVEGRAGEDSLTLHTSQHNNTLNISLKAQHQRLPLNALIDIAIIGPLCIVFYGKQRVEEDVEESEANGGTEPRHEDDEPELQPKTKIVLPAESL